MDRLRGRNICLRMVIHDHPFFLFYRLIVCLQHGGESHCDGTSSTEGAEGRCGALEVGWDWWGTRLGWDDTTGSDWSGGGKSHLGGRWAHGGVGAHGNVGGGGWNLRGGEDKGGHGRDLGDADGASGGLGEGGDNGGSGGGFLRDGEAEEAKEDGDDVDELHFGGLGFDRSCNRGGVM